MSKRTDRRYYIRFSLRYAEPVERKTKSGARFRVWPTAAWPILFPTRAAAEAHIKYVDMMLFANDGSDNSKAIRKKGRFKSTSVEICKKPRRVAA